MNNSLHIDGTKWKLRTITEMHKGAQRIVKQKAYCLCCHQIYAKILTKVQNKSIAVGNKNELP